MSHANTTDSTSAADPRRWAAAAVLTGAFLLDLIDITIVNEPCQ